MSKPTNVEESPAGWTKWFQWRLADGFEMKKLRADPGATALLAMFDNAEIVSAERTGPMTGRLTVKFPVMRGYLNPAGTLQGGMQTAIYDVFTAWVFAFAPNWTYTTSRTLNTSFFRPGALDEMLLMECELVHVGKTLGMSRGVLKREKDGAIISSCEHHMVNVTPPPSKI